MRVPNYSVVSVLIAVATIGLYGCSNQATGGEVSTPIDDSSAAPTINISETGAIAIVEKRPEVQTWEKKVQVQNGKPGFSDQGLDGLVYDIYIYKTIGGQAFSAGWYGVDGVSGAVSVIQPLQ